MTLSASSSSEPLTFLFYQDRTLSFPSFLIYQFSSGSHCLTWLLCDRIWPPRSQTFSLFCNLFVPSGMLSPVQHFNLPSFYCFIHKVYLGLTRQAFHLMFNIILFSWQANYSCSVSYFNLIISVCSWHFYRWHLRCSFDSIWTNFKKMRGS